MSVSSTGFQHAQKIFSPFLPTGSARLVKVIPSEQIINRWRQELDADITAEFHGCREILLYECENTGIKFFRPAEVAGSMAIYSVLSEKPWYYGTGKWEHASAIADLAGAKLIAEIGAGTGAFVRLAASAGLDVLGYELSRDAIDKAKTEGISLVHANLEDLSRDRPESFDAACCFQVLEHIADPLPFIQGMFKLVRPGGRVLFSVPNDDGYLGHADNLLNIPPHHMSLWSRRALTSFGQFVPAKLICCRMQPLANYEIPQYLASKARKLKASPLLSKAFTNRIATIAMRIAVKAGFGRLWAGHTFYAVYEKL